MGQRPGAAGIVSPGPAEANGRNVLATKARQVNLRTLPAVGSRKSGWVVPANRPLNYLAESIAVNVGGRPGTGQQSAVEARSASETS